MASTIGLSPENLLQRSQNYSSYGWFRHRVGGVAVSREAYEEDRLKSKSKRNSLSKEVSVSVSDLAEVADLKRIETPVEEFGGFEFVLEDPVTMQLPADELFSDGKLVPMRFSVIQQEVAGLAASTSAATSSESDISGVGAPDTPYPRRITDDAFADDPYLFSPRAPRCSSRWKELLGFRKLNNAKVDNHNKRTSTLSTLSSSHISTGGTKSIRQLLYRTSKSSIDSSISLPLLRDPDTESASVSVSSRPSLSSSSSGHDIDDLPRLSLDSDKPGKFNLNLNLNLNSKVNNRNNRPKSRMIKTKTAQAQAQAQAHLHPQPQTQPQTAEGRSTTRVGRSTHRRSTDRGLSVDSPRLNSSGKIIFHSLERSSSSPSSFNGGPRIKHRGMERSYSANVRITPVLNVPVCSLSKSGGMFGFPAMFSSKREANSSNNNGGSNRSQRFKGKCRTDC